MPDIKSLGPKIFGTLLALSAVFAVSTATVVLAADAYPSKPVRLILPQPPGGGTDVVGRVIAAKLAERLGVQVVAENRAGGATIIGTEFVAKSMPDGYTLLFVPASYATNAALLKLPYDPMNSFSPIAKIGDTMNTLVVHPSVLANSLKEFIALAKQKPHQLIFASQGAGTQIHMSTELFKMMAGIDIKLVQFKGGGPAAIDLLGGHSHALVGSIAQNLPYIKSGKFRTLCAFGVKRSVLLPDVPTSGEAGVPGSESGSWFGIMAPAGTPAPIIERLNKEVKAILDSNETEKLLLNQGTDADYQGPTEFAAFIKSEIIKWTGVVKKANIKLEE